MTGSQPFSERVGGHLRLADHRLRTSDPGSSRRRYAVCRMTMTNIAPVDSFYIGFFHGEDTIVIPYIYDHDIRCQPDITRYGKGGLSHWVRSSGKPYVYASDDGALLSRTIPFGNVDEESQDAVVVPLRDPDTHEVTGLMSVQSLRPNAFGPEVVKAAMWLAEALMLAQARDRHVGSGEASLYTDHPELNSAIAGDSRERLAQITDQLETANRRSADIAAAIESLGDEQLHRQASTLRALLEQIQSDIAEWMLAAPSEAGPAPDNRLHADLTPRELEIATLIATDQLTNNEIAQTLQISLKTVKTHVGNVLSKLGVSQRSAIVFAMAEVLAMPPAEITPKGRS